MEWLLTGEGEMVREGSEGGSGKYKAGDPLDEDPEIAEFLKMTGTVLKSGTEHAETLITNIRSSHRNLIKDRDLENMLAALEEMAHPPMKASQG